MALRIWLHRLATVLGDLSMIRRGHLVVLWRLRQTSDVAETACSFTEPAPGVFHVLLTCNGRPEIRRLMHGIDTLVSWSEGVKARLQADGWREVDAPERSPRILRPIRDDSHTIAIGGARLRKASQSPNKKRR